MPISSPRRSGLRHDLAPVGADGAAIVAELGYTEAEIAALLARGVLHGAG